MTTDHYRPARDARSRAARAGAVQPAARPHPPRDRRGAGLGGASQGVDPARGDLARGAGQAAGAAQVGAQGPAGQATRPSAASPPRRPAELARIFMSPGPIFEPEGCGEDWWRAARALFAAGIRKGDIVHNTFAYHLTPGGWILDSGARALGCAVIAAGPGNTEQQLEVIQALEAHRLRRRAGLPQDPARQGQGGRQGRLLASRRRWSAAARCSPRCGPSTSSAASPPTRPTPPPTSASSPTRARRSRA